MLLLGTLSTSLPSAPSLPLERSCLVGRRGPHPPAGPWGPPPALTSDILKNASYQSPISGPRALQHTGPPSPPSHSLKATHVHASFHQVPVTHTGMGTSWPHCVTVPSLRLLCWTVSTAGKAASPASSSPSWQSASSYRTTPCQPPGACSS